jgi:4-hydroxyphenylpyruvate dioxygenase-like putative hemolysin
VSLTDPVEQAHTVYNGSPSPARAKLAFIQMGQVSIELIEPVGGPSTWKDFLDQHGEGVHHIAFQVKDTPKVVAGLNEKQIPLVQQGDYTGGMYSYLDSAPQLGVILELLENF